MPRISEARRQERREQILAAARTCFARNGFHQTSMDDLLAEAGLSAGAFYRYFRSKDEVINAVAAETVGAVTSEVAAIVGERPQPEPLDAVRRVLRLVHAMAAPGHPGRLALQVWGEAQRDAGMAELARNYSTALRASVASLVPDVAGAGPEQDSTTDRGSARSTRVSGRAEVLFAAMLGFLIQTALIGDVDPDSFADELVGLL